MSHNFVTGLRTLKPKTQKLSNLFLNLGFPALDKTLHSLFYLINRLLQQPTFDSAQES